ncbi:MAG: hypothetical protein ACI39R_07250 [Lachnospiraceae bacterium]
MIQKSISKSLIIMLICVAITVSAIPVTVNADTGPKASVHINFENMGDELCYGTLLSETESTGPSSVWDGTETDAKHNGNENYPYATIDYATWKAFAEYEDSDGYYFLQEAWIVSKTKEIAWTYYPPNRFKILLYYPETQTFLVSGICERYAFDTYYTVDMDGISIASVQYNEELSTDERIEAYRSYNFTMEIIALIARIIITILAEMVVAVLFGFRKKKQVLLLVGVNVVTQIILNVGLNVIDYNSGRSAVEMYYGFFEIMVFAIEAGIYCIWMKKLSEEPKKNWYYILYSLVANVASFAIGFPMSAWVPGLF